jgi:hypothetical protein
MPQSTIVSIAIGIIVVAVIFGFKKFFSAASIYASSFIASLKLLGELAEQIKLARQDTSEHAKLIKGYFGGLAKVCEAQTAELIKFREALESFTRVVVDTSAENEARNQKAYHPPEEYDEGRADHIFAVQQLRAQGLSADEAESRVQADEQTRIFSNNPGL